MPEAVRDDGQVPQDRPEESSGGILGDLDVDYAERGTGGPEYAISADGTRIAYESTGSGPAVVVVGGGLNDRAMFSPFAELLSGNHTVYTYDRRGRGDSEWGDPDSWVIEREIEDLAAVLDVVEGPAHVFANCTGGMVALLAAARGVPVERLGLYEPPYWSTPTTGRQLSDLRRYIEEDRRDEVVTLFARDIVGFIDEESIEQFKSHPAWSAFKTMVRSTYYDALINRDHLEVPRAELRKITSPTLVLRGDIGQVNIHEACAAIAQEVPGARLLTMEGHDHLFNQKAGAPLLMEFFSE